VPVLPALTPSGLHRSSNIDEKNIDENYEDEFVILAQPSLMHRPHCSGLSDSEIQWFTSSNSIFSQPTSLEHICLLGQVMRTIQFPTVIIIVSMKSTTMIPNQDIDQVDDGADDHSELLTD
jgi:hypothetical protein